MKAGTNVTDDSKIGIGLDSCLIPLKNNLYLIQSTDFFYPLIDDPYVMGKITCANVLSDIYAIGVVNIDSLSIIISVCDNMSTEERNIVIPLIIKGFKRKAQSVGLKVNIQSAIYNPWCIIGGTATAVCTEDEYINPLQIEMGDVIVLTKPLGAQIACNANRWSEDPEKWQKLSTVVNKEVINHTFECAVKSMSRLNKNAAQLMHKYNAHGSTDITGFGILGHAENLAAFQKNKIKLIIHTLPVIKNVLKIAEVTGSKDRFLNGKSPETSGGLLICLKENVADDYCEELKSIDGWDAWIIGSVENGDNVAIISANPKIIEVDCNI